MSSLAEIGAAEWDEVARPSGFYLSRDWLRLVEADTSATAEYLLGYDGNRLVAVLPLYDVHSESLGLYQPGRLADGRWAGRYLLAGSRRGFRNGFLVSTDLPADERAAAFRALLPAVGERVRSRGADGALFLHLPTGAAREMWQAGAAEFAGLPLLTLVDAAIGVPGEGMDDYVQSIPSQTRRKIRREIKMFEQAGYEIAEERLAGCLAEAKSLVCNLQHRYGHLDDDEEWRGELDHMADLLGDQGVVFSARHEGALVGFTLGYPVGDTMYMRRCGFDYEALRDAFEYFNLGYYLPLRYAYRHGLRRLHLGPTAYEAKVRRGAALAPLWSLALFTHAAQNTVGDLDWNRKAAGEWFDHYEQGSPVLADPGWAEWGCTDEGAAEAN